MSYKDKPLQNLSHKEIELLMMDYISGRMNADETTAFDELLAENPTYSQEVVELKQMLTWVAQHEDSDLPEPSAQMDESFYHMLHEEVATEVKAEQRWWHSWFQVLKLPQVRKLAYGTSFLFFGVFIGHYLHLLGGQNNLEAERLAIKDQQIQALTVLSLLDMPSANKRLMAVNLAGMSDQPTDSIVEALLVTLKQDNNVNVRLEALEVLAQFSEQSTVRSGLVQAISYQDSPMVQMALANLMQQLNEPEAVEPMQRLLEQPELIDPVRAKLNETVNELI